jgi:hypothetical protein
MPELLQFSLLDMTPYDRQSWFNLLAAYHRAIWPLQLPALLLLIAVPAGVLRQHKSGIKPSVASRLVLALLGLSWLWCGGVFHLSYFSALNWAAQLFGVVFLVQGGLLLLAAALLRTAHQVALNSPRGWLGMALLLTGLLIYPLSGLPEGRTLLQLEMFPLMPAPVTLVTVALLMLLNSAWRYGLVIIPLLWGVVSAAFAWTLGLAEFYFMAGALLLWLVSMVLPTGPGQIRGR